MAASICADTVRWCRSTGGRFRVVPRDVVLADVRSQVEAGARHITFGDPDFFNGVGHAVAIVEAFAREHPGVSYDVTIKIEHLRQHDDRLAVLRDTGCLFVVSAVESIDDAVLARLDKGHTRADFEQVVARCRQVGLTLAPTFIPFTPWTTLAGYHELLRTIDTLDLVAQVAPIQLALRLLIPHESRLLELDRARLGVELGPFDTSRLVYPWRHPDPRVDRLQARVADIIGPFRRPDLAPLEQSTDTLFAGIARNGGTNWTGGAKWNYSKRFDASTNSAWGRSRGWRASWACIGGWCARR